MIRLALAGLRFRIAAFVATFLAVLIGCALLIACGGLFESALRLTASVQRFDAAPVVVAGPSGFKLPDQESETVAYAERSRVDAGLADQIAEIPGVDAALPDVSFPAVLASDPQADPDSLSGHDWASAGLTPYALRSGDEPHAAGQVVLDPTTAEAADAAPGSTIELVVSGRPETFTVTGVAVPEHTVDAPAFFFASDDAQRFAAEPGAVDAIGVLPAPGTSEAELAERISDHLPPGPRVLTGDDRGTAEFVGVTGSMLPLILLSSIFGGMVMVVMALVVWATISLSVRQRQRELALLRATGGTPDQVRRMVVAETMIVSVLATAGGMALGRLMGGWIFDQSVRRGVVAPTLEFQQGIIPFAAGSVLALLVPWIAARFAARAAARTRPIQALAEASIPPVTVSPLRRLLAIIFAVGTVGLATTTMFFDPETAAATGGPALLTGAITVALLGPEVINIFVRRTAGVIRRVAGRDGALAVINTRTRATQFAAVLTPLTLATAIALGNVYSETTLADASLAASVDQFQADVVVTSDAGGIAPDLLDEVRDTAGAGSVSALVFSAGWIEQPYDGRGSDPLTVVGIDAQDDADPVLATAVTAGSLSDLTGNSVALPERDAATLDIALGDQVTMRLGDGSQADVAVVALLDSPPDYASLVLPAELLAPHTTSGLPSHVLVRVADGDDGGRLADALRSSAEAWPGTDVGNAELLRDTFAEGLDIQAWINYLLAALAVAYAAIASVNTLTVAVLSRRREFAVQRLAGATHRQVRRMLLIEAAIIGVAGLVLGTVIAAFTVLPMAMTAGVIIPTGPLWVFVAMIVAVFAIVWPATLAASGLAMKRQPIEAVNAPMV